MSHTLSLKNYWEKIKPRLLIVNFFLMAILGFGLGRLTKLEEAREPIRIEADNLATTTVKILAGKFVGSKNGTKYHYPWCPGATKIKEENKIWFQTIEDAKRAGYTPAANCPGL